MTDEQNIEVLPKSKKSIIKKIVTVSIITLAILFPTLLAFFIGGYIDNSNDIADFENVEVALYNTNGDLLFEQKGVDNESIESSLVKIFSAISSNISRSNASPDLSKYAAPITAIIKDGVSSTTLECYFSTEQRESYCFDTSGQLYYIPEMYCDYFLNSYFAESLYQTAVPPTLIAGDGEQILPYDVTWNYLNSSGDFFEAKLFDTTSDKLSFTMTGGITLDFSIPPDECNVSVFDGNEIIFSGTLDTLKTASLSDSPYLTLSIHAIWQKQNVRLYYGEQHFEFQVAVQNKAEFSVDTLSVGTDQLILITATNVSDPSKLSFASDFPQNSPAFQKKDGVTFALLSVPSLEVDDKFTFSVAYGITAKEFTVNITSPVIESTSEAAVALGIKFKNASSLTNKYVFLGTPFADADPTYFVKRSEYGATVDLEGNEFQSPFTEYVCHGASAISVRSLSSGMVVFAGESETLGKYVIIDLGLELKLWYCYLDEVSVFAGDYIAAGDVLGTVGTILTNASGAQGFCTMFTYREIIVSPSCVFEKQSYLNSQN